MDPILRHMLIRDLEEAGFRPMLDHPTAQYTTYGVGGPAAMALFPVSIMEVQHIMQILRHHDVTPVIIGGGSNVLISDRGIDAVVLFTGSLDACVVKGSIMRCSAGAQARDVADKALEAGLSGAEFLGGLPGTIGGAAYMNARAFGQEMSQIMVSAMVVTLEGRLQRLDLSPGDFAYKSSPFKKRKDTIVAVELALTPDEPEEIAARMEQQRQHRERNGEHLYPSCGCVFKNPLHTGRSAGRIIDELGLKGTRNGHAWVHDGHANFIVHDGRATASEIRQLMEQVRRTVAEQTGITLEYEVEFLGEWQDNYR